MNTVTAYQNQKIQNFVRAPMQMSPLVLMGDGDVRSQILNQICDVCGFRKRSAQEVAVMLIEHMANPKQTDAELYESIEPALVIDEMDFFKNRECLQKELLWLILKCRYPVVLTLNCYEVFSPDMRRLISESHLVNLNNIK